jgi:hypothetical protein
MHLRDDISFDIVTKLLEYRPDEGTLIWKTRPQEMFPDSRACKIWNTKNAGKVAGSISKRSNRVSITIFKVARAAPRLIWLIVYGEYPPHDVDHVDNNPLNNRLSNLRAATRPQNLWNRRINKNNSCGLKGVCLDKRRNQWKAEIMVHRKKMFLGYFSTKEEAHHAYQKASFKLHGEYSPYSE